jgi:hypothetical protein
VGLNLVDLVGRDALDRFVTPPQLIDPILELDVIQFDLLQSPLVAIVDLVGAPESSEV